MPMITSATGRLLLGVLCGFVFGVVLYQSSGVGGGFSFGSLRGTIIIPEGGCGYSKPPEGCLEGETTNGIYCYLPSGSPCVINGKNGTCDQGTCTESPPAPVTSCTYPIPVEGCPPGRNNGIVCLYPEGAQCILNGSFGTCDANGTCVATATSNSSAITSSFAIENYCVECSTCMTTCAATMPPGTNCNAQCAGVCGACSSSSSSMAQMSIPPYQYYCCLNATCSQISLPSECVQGFLYNNLASCTSACIASSVSISQFSSSSSQSMCCNGNQCVPYITSSVATSALACNPPCVAPKRCVKDPADPAPTCR